MSKKSDFRYAFEELSLCTGRLVCGCIFLDDDDRLYVDSLKRKCKEYLDAYDKRFGL